MLVIYRRHFDCTPIKLVLLVVLSTTTLRADFIHPGLLHSKSDLARMKADADFTDVRTSFETGRPEVTLDIDRGRAADVGLSATSMGRTLRTLLAGEKVGSFEDLGNRYDVRVQVLPEYRDDPAKPLHCSV